MKKKALWLALAILMLLTLFSMTVFAADGQALINLGYGQYMTLSNVVSQKTAPVTDFEEWLNLTGDHESVSQYLLSFDTVEVYYCNAPATITIPDSRPVEIINWYYDTSVSAGSSSIIKQLETIDDEFLVGSVTFTGNGTYLINDGWTADFGSFFLIVGDDNPTPPTATPPASDEIKIIVNGAALTFDQPPIIQDGRTLVPLRVIFEALGADVNWEQSTQTITATRGDVTVLLRIGSNILTKNEEQVELDVPAQIVGGRTLVPARAVAEGFGAQVGWDQSIRTVTITE